MGSDRRTADAAAEWRPCERKITRARTAYSNRCGTGIPGQARAPALGLRWVRRDEPFGSLEGSREHFLGSLTPRKWIGDEALRGEHSPVMLDVAPRNGVHHTTRRSPLEPTLCMKPDPRAPLLGTLRSELLNASEYSLARTELQTVTGACSPRTRIPRPGRFSW